MECFHVKRFIICALLLNCTPALAQSVPDIEGDCVSAAQFIIAELEEVDADHGIVLRELARQLLQESSDSPSGPYICQAYVLMGERGTLRNIALEYYLD